MIYPLLDKLHLIPEHFQPGRPLGPPNEIVLHITEGTTASGAIASSEQSVKPKRKSFHFIIDRDGTVTQCVDTDNVAWHASEANMRSVGIEHVSLSQPGADALNEAHPGQHFVALPATDAQYAASAKLIAWICRAHSIPCDRTHILTHNQSSPLDGHVLCCTGGLDPDRVVSMAAVIV